MQSDDTPITMPGKKTRAETNGVVAETVEFETTDQIASGVSSAAADQGSFEELAAALLGKLAESSGGGGGSNGGSADDTLKEIKRHKWLAALMSLLLGSGGMFGSYYALKSRAENNTRQVGAVEAAAKSSDNRITRNMDEIRLIKVDVSGINASVTGMKSQQTAIVDGIESLKQVNVDRLEKENAKLERKLRMMERDR